MVIIIEKLIYGVFSNKLLYSFIFYVMLMNKKKSLKSSKCDMESGKGE